MSKPYIQSLLLAAILATTVSAVPQAPAAPSAAPAPTGCPAPGEGRGPRPGGPGGPGGPGRGAAQGAPGAAPGPALAQGAGRGQGGPGGPPSGPAKKRLLIWADTRNGIAQHDIGHAMAVIEELGYKSGLWDTWIRTDSNIIARRPKMTTGEPASGGPNLCNVDAIFFLGHREIDLDAQGKADLIWFIKDAGKGFVAAHTGTTAFMLSWPEFGEMLGGEFDEHPWGSVEAPVIVTDRKFPGLENFPPVFNIKEEFYQSKGFSPEKSRVLMRLDTTKTDNTKRGVQAADYPYPLVWARNYGKGRVFYSAFGHAPATWDNPMLQEMYTGAIKWALGLVDADATPLPMPPPAPGALPPPAAPGNAP
jgi:type 1 glutamine amidotransferase